MHNKARLSTAVAGMRGESASVQDREPVTANKEFSFRTIRFGDCRSVSSSPADCRWDRGLSASCPGLPHTGLRQGIQPLQEMMMLLFLIVPDF